MRVLAQLSEFFRLVVSFRNYIPMGWLRSLGATQPTHVVDPCLTQQRERTNLTWDFNFFFSSLHFDSHYFRAIFSSPQAIFQLYSPLI